MTQRIDIYFYPHFKNFTSILLNYEIKTCKISKCNEVCNSLSLCPLLMEGVKLSM